VSRKAATGAGVGLIVALGAAWFVLERKVDRLEGALNAELERVAGLQSMVGDSNTRIDENYRRMEEARIRRESADQRIQEAETVVSAAAEERTEAQTLTEEAREAERQAREKAAAARRNEEAERRRREEEWSRLGRALAKVGATNREDRTLTTSLPSALLDDKERISLLAGVLLAHHGYRASVEGDGAQAVVDYLTEAGIPADIVTRGAASGRSRLILQDQILGAN
jgi:chromosome segregation ATPase